MIQEVLFVAGRLCKLVWNIRFLYCPGSSCGSLSLLCHKVSLMRRDHLGQVSLRDRLVIPSTDHNIIVFDP